MDTKMDIRKNEAQKVAKTWRMNDERNKRIEAKKQRMQELDDIALIEEGDYCD
jgi:hypothetical protein